MQFIITFKKSLKKIILLLFLLFAVFLLISCQKKAEEQFGMCASPMVQIGEKCCLDSNNDSICDELEAKKSEEIKTEPKLEVVPEKKYIGLAELESSILDAFSPQKDFTFQDMERENVTGIENTYIVRESKDDGFLILKIKKPYNYLNTFDNFSLFVNRLYELDVKNNKIWADSYLDYMELENLNWKNERYDYEHSLENVEIKNKNISVEKHMLLFISRYNSADGALSYPKINIWCTPELVVQVYSSELSDLGWTSGSSPSDVEANLRRENELFLTEMKERAEKVVNICELGELATGKTDIESPEIRVYGKEGFEPEEVIIKAGNKVIFSNEDTRKTSIMVVIKKDNSPLTTNTGVIEPEKKSEYLFNEPGNYTCWLPDYSLNCRIIVNN